MLARRSKSSKSSYFDERRIRYSQEAGSTFDFLGGAPHCGLFQKTMARGDEQDENRGAAREEETLDLLRKLVNLVQLRFFVMPDATAAG